MSDPSSDKDEATPSAYAPDAETQKIVVLWKSGHTSRSRFTFSAEQALGRRGTIGMLRVEDGIVLDGNEERRSVFADGIVNSARALARSCDLVIVEID